MDLSHIAMDRSAVNTGGSVISIFRVVAFVCLVFLLFSVYMCGLPEMIASWVWLVKWHMPILDWKNDDNWEEHYRLLKWCMGTYDKRMVCELQLAEISP